MALKTLGSVGVDTKRMFTGLPYNICETVNGDFVFLNGQPVADRTLLEQLPQQHIARALEWWNRTFGGTEAATSAKSAEIEEIKIEAIIQPDAKPDAQPDAKVAKDRVADTRAEKILSKMGLKR
jgi:hypothetical protein